MHAAQRRATGRGAGAERSANKCRGFGQTTISWNAPGYTAVEVHSGAPDGPLVIAGGSSGSVIHRGGGEQVWPGVVPSGSRDAANAGDGRCDGARGFAYRPGARTSGTSEERKGAKRGRPSSGHSNPAELTPAWRDDGATKVNFRASYGERLTLRIRTATSSGRAT